MSATINTEDGFLLELKLMLSAPRGVLWRCWSEPELFCEWFCPKPWRMTSAQLDLRPGGRMNNVMESPAGERMENKGMYLYVERGVSCVFTDAYTEDFVPAPDHFMTGYFSLRDSDEGTTEMNWGARHPTFEKAEQHRNMGWEQGWRVAAAQLESLAKSL